MPAEPTAPETPMRHPPAAPVAGSWRFGNVRFDERNMRLTVRGVEAEAPKKVLQVLRELLHCAGEVVSKEELAESCWPRRILSETVLTTTIGRLRAALGETEAAAIQVVRGLGYRLAVPVSFDGPVPPAAPRLDLKAGDHPPDRAEWRLIEPLGVGGQADLWLGRDGENRLRVFKFAVDMRAVAALKRELAISRLLKEVAGGDIAAAGFVRVLDGQFEHLPAFIASEWIGGGNLDQWTQARGGLATIPLEQRLELAAQCAESLAIAHGASILHKDLKPANMLVDDSGTSPRIRLTDFGSATIMDRERLRRFAMTRLGLTPTVTNVDSSSGTPLYMAPEVLAGQPSTERSDLYALGILLYQLVVGDFRRPLAAGWEADVPDEVLRDDIAQTAAGDPLRRLSDAAEFARRLRSLPERRERRAQEHREALRAAALQRQLDQYRQRRPLLIGIGLVLIAGLAVTSVLSWQLRAALDQARRQSEVASAVNDFVQKDLLAAADPGQAGKPDPSMREVLEAADAKITERFGGQPLQEGAVRTTLGSAWHLIGNDMDAERHLRRAVAVLAPLGEEARLETARAHLALSRNLAVRGIEDYAPHLDRAQALVAGRDDLQSWKIAAQVRFLRARLHAWKGENTQALAILDPLHAEVAQRLPADDGFRVRLRMEQLAMMSNLGRSAEAVAIARELMPRLEHGSARNLGEAADLHRLTVLMLSDAGQREEAGAEAPLALARFTAVYGAGNAETLRTRMMFAGMKTRHGRFDEGIAELRALVAPLRAAQGDLVFSAKALELVADAVVDAGQWQTAEADARAALAEAQALTPDAHAVIGIATARLAYVLTRLGRRDEAAPLFEQAMPLVRAHLEPSNQVYPRVMKQYEEFLAIP